MHAFQEINTQQKKAAGNKKTPAVVKNGER